MAGIAVLLYAFLMDWKKWLSELQQWAGNWPSQAQGYFTSVWGLQPAFAIRVAILYLALYMLGLSPRITSGFRDPEKQANMRARWDAGDRSGLRVRPADPNNSKHCRTSMTGAPASEAIDMPCSDDKRAAEIGRALGLAAGFFFNTPDPGHFQTVS